MQLLIDIGNTRLKWRWSQQGKLLPGGAEPLPAPGKEGELFSRIWDAGGPPERILISDVSGELLRGALRAWAKEQWSREAEFVTSAPQLAGVRNGYQVPSTLGVDRWCALIGARAIAGGRVCVVDCGTAITVDLLSADGRHEGGLVSPGLSTMIRSLAGAARGLRLDVEPGSPSAPLGHSTVECIQAGTLAAASGMVEHTLAKLAFPGDALVLLTGGDAELLAATLQVPCRIEPDLVFLGLAEIGALK